MMVLAIMSIFNPYVWIQPGGQLYLVYQGWLGLIKPMVYQMPSYQRWLMMTGIALGWSWVSNGYITIIQSLLYAPLTMIQMVLVPGWIMYLYTGWLLPGLSFLTAVIVDVMLWIPVIPVMYLVDIILGLYDAFNDLCSALIDHLVDRGGPPHHWHRSWLHS
jgi:hypothetical protein